MVRFPSEQDGTPGQAENAEHLAPVTPLRRSGAKPSGEHPAGRSRGTGGSRGVVGLPVVELPVGDAPAGGLPAGGPPVWNNTWGDTPPDTDTDTDAGPEPVADADAEERDRQSRRASGLTIRQLARRGMSRWELEQLLAKRDIPEEVSAPELDRLESLGIIDDASLALSLAFTQHSRKGLGRTAIELDLRRRHIAPDLIEAALAGLADEDELEKATELATKRIAQLASYDDETTRRRLHAFLARKGYDSSVIRQALEAAFATRKRRGVRFQ